MKVTYTEEAVADIVDAITDLNERNPTAAPRTKHLHGAPRTPHLAPSTASGAYLQTRAA